MKHLHKHIHQVKHTNDTPSPSFMGYITRHQVTIYYSLCYITGQLIRKLKTFVFENKAIALSTGSL